MQLLRVSRTAQMNCLLLAEDWSSIEETLVKCGLDAGGLRRRVWNIHE